MKDEIRERVLELEPAEQHGQDRRPRRRRSRRDMGPRARILQPRKISRAELAAAAADSPPVDVPRPSTRAACRGAMRPCPWVSCKYHLYLDVNPETGSIKLNRPDLEPWELEHSCALDVAERGGITLEETGDILNVTRERVRQIEISGLIKLRMGSPSPDELGAAPLNQTSKSARRRA